jgi:2-methylcitrate dehydratase PrpD
MEINQGEEILDGLARNILTVRFEQIDKGTVHNTKMRLLDTLGGALGAARLPDILTLVRLVEGWAGRKEATIIGHGIQAPLHNVAWVNCVMCRGFDRSPLAYVFRGRIVPHHVSETTVLTALALAEYKNVNGRELITALVMGDDLAARLHLAKDHPLPGEFKPESQPPRRLSQPGIMTHTFGAAAIAGRLLGLTPQQMNRALGLVGNSDSFAGGIWDGAPTFKMGQGTSAQIGILAAQLAQGGWSGLIDPLFNPRGGLFRDGCDHPELLTENLGREFYVEGLFKPFPGGGPTQAPTAAAIALKTKHQFPAEEIEEAILRTAPGVSTGLHYARPYKVGDYPSGDALFSYKYAVANGLARGSARDADYSEEAVRDPRVQSLIERVTLALAELAKPEGVELEVRLKDGRRFSEYVVQPQGTPDKPLPREILIGKFREQVEFSGLVNQPAAGRLIELIENLESVQDVRELVKLAVKQP